MGYDADEQRVLKRNSRGATYTFNKYGERDTTGRLVKSYWAGSRLIARRDGTGRLAHVHPDHLGSPRLLTDSAGNVTERLSYDPFGKYDAVHQPVETVAQDRRLWRGARVDHDTGLVYMNARFYDPELARFVSADSVIPDPYRPQSLDRYAYAENDPINYSDPTGHARSPDEGDESSLLRWMELRAQQNVCDLMPWACEPAPSPNNTGVGGRFEPEERSYPSASPAGEPTAPDAQAADAVTGQERASGGESEPADAGDAEGSPPLTGTVIVELGTIEAIETNHGWVSVDDRGVAHPKISSSSLI